MAVLHTVQVVLLGSSKLRLFSFPFKTFIFPGVVVLFSTIVLALSAALINTAESEGFYFIFAALALAVSLLCRL